MENNEVLSILFTILLFIFASCFCCLLFIMSDSCCYDDPPISDNANNLIYDLNRQTDMTNNNSQRQISRTQSAITRERLSLQQTPPIIPPSESLINQSTSCVIVSEETHSEHLECAICMEHYPVGSIQRVLPCLHRYHVDCIDYWFLMQEDFNQCNCPICHYSISRNTNLQANHLIHIPPSLPSSQSSNNNYQTVQQVDNNLV